MDPFSQRLRKQRERSSLQARQLNKNAHTMLQRQLNALDRQQRQNARVHFRTRQTILMELETFPDSTQDVAVTGVSTQHRPAPLPFLMASPGQSATSEQAAPFALGSSSLNDVNVCKDENQTSGTAGGASHPRSLSLQDLRCDSSQSPCTSRPSYSWSSRQKTDADAHKPCRFGAMSPLTPCRYFPCCRPKSYHHLKFSDIPDPVCLTAEAVDLSPIPRNTCSSNSCSDASSPLKSSSTATGFSSTPRGRLDCGEGGSSSLGPGGRQGSAGHASPRTSINERMRGLRQLVRELRDKNEEKRPRAWAVNYGDAVSKRLLRKPVVPVSEKALS